MVAEKRRRSREDYERGLPDYHDPTAGFGGAAPARSALTLRAVLAAFGLVISAVGAGISFGNGFAVIGWVLIAVAVVAFIDLIVILARKRRGEPGWELNAPARGAPSGLTAVHRHVRQACRALDPSTASDLIAAVRQAAGQWLACAAIGSTVLQVGELVKIVPHTRARQRSGWDDQRLLKAVPRRERPLIRPEPQALAMFPNFAKSSQL
jgi:hypothetical protein